MSVIQLGTFDTVYMSQEKDPRISKAEPGLVRFWLGSTTPEDAAVELRDLYMSVMHGR